MSVKLFSNVIIYLKSECDALFSAIAHAHAHNDLSGVSADQHHAQSHAHSTHSSIGADDHHAQAHAHTHAATTGQTADDHHAQAHTLASHSSKAHADLASIGADDHHAQSHTLASHSSKAHADLGSIGADDHHDHVTLDANADAILSLSTQAIGLDTQAANKVLAGPASGAAAVPTMRALVFADLPAVPMAKATLITTNQTLVNNTWTDVALNGEDYDTDTIHDTATNNERLTCKTAGKYLVLASAYFAASGVGYRGIQIFKNTTAGNQNWPVLGIAVYGNVLIVDDLLNLAVNDYVKFQAWHNAGGNLDLVKGLCFLAMVRVG